jgi:hypothetical protein
MQLPIKWHTALNIQQLLLGTNSDFSKSKRSSFIAFVLLSSLLKIPEQKISGVACLFNADVASSGDHATRWACDLKIPSSIITHSNAVYIFYVLNKFLVFD